MRCHPILCCWSVWQYYQDLLMPLTISLSLSFLLSSPLPASDSLFLSAAFLLSWNCNRRTKWLANPFSEFLGTVSEHKHWSWNAVICIYAHAAADNDTKQPRQVPISLVCESTMLCWNKHLRSLKCFQYSVSQTEIQGVLKDRRWLVLKGTKLKEDSMNNSLIIKDSARGACESRGVLLRLITVV